MSSTPLKRFVLPKMTAIVAMDLNGNIGNRGDMPWGKSFPEDLKHFKKVTSGKLVLMGRKTFESIGHALPNRTNVLVTRNPDFGKKVYHKHGVAWCNNVNETLLRDLLHIGYSQICVIGGSEIYRLCEPYLDEIVVTHINVDYGECDTKFPIDLSEWVSVSSENLTDKMIVKTYVRARK